MKTSSRNYWLSLYLSLLIIVGLFSNPVFASSPSTKKRSETDRNINAIGHRKIAYTTANWYSLEKEKEIGEKLSVNLERSSAGLSDSKIASYLQRLGQTIAQNSDTQLPITVRAIDSEEVYALTLPGGYQYISRGLLLQLQSEGELASVIARGIAHTALRSAASEQAKAMIMQGASIPVIFAGNGIAIHNTSAADLSVPLTFLKLRRDEEFDADYFGVQYLYKAGYDTGCFIRFIQTVWSASGKPFATAFSPFPPLSERLEALEKETANILPKRDGAVTSTREFTDFREHLQSLPSAAPVKPHPRLLRVKPQSAQG